MKIQTNAECSTDAEHLVPPVNRRRRRVLLGHWQAALQAATIFISVISLTLSSIVFMVLLYTPASGPLGQARDVADLRAISDLQRQMIGRLQREASYLDARQKVLQSALAAAGLLDDPVKARLEGIERALAAKEAEEAEENLPELKSIPAEDNKGRPLIGRPDGHERGHSADEDRSLIGRPDGHERGYLAEEEEALRGGPDVH